MVFILTLTCLLSLIPWPKGRAEESPKPNVPLTAEGQTQAERQVKSELAEAAGQKAEPQPTSPALSAVEGIEAIKKALGLSIYLQATNFCDTRGDENLFHVFDHQANTVTFDIGEIVLNHDAEKGGFGGKFKMITGETAYQGVLPKPPNWENVILSR